MTLKTVLAYTAVATAALLANNANAGVQIHNLAPAQPAYGPTATVSVGFPSSSTFYHSATNGDGYIPAGGQSAFMWTAGDYVSQTFSGTGLTDVSSLYLSNQFQNYLGGYGGETWYLLINGTPVAGFVAPEDNNSGNIWGVAGGASFAPVAAVAGAFTLEWQLQNTIPTGGGSIAWLDGGAVELTGAVPEPGTWAMMLAGIGLMGFVLRRRSAAQDATA